MSEWAETVGIVEGTVGLVLNTLAWLVILRTKSLHNMTNYLLAYLAVVDSMLCSELILHSATAGIFVHTSSLGREIYCRIVNNSFLGMLTVYSSSYGLCLVTYERYIGIVHPLHYPRVMSPKNVTLIIFMIWVISFLLSSPLLFIQIARKDNGTIVKACFFITDLFYIITNTEMVLCFVFSYLLPILFMSWAYYKIQATLKRSAQQFSQDEVQAAASKLFKARQNVISTLRIIMGALVVLWTPFLLVQFICIPNVTICNANTYKLMTVLGLIYNLNSVINPIIYAFKYKKFQKGLQDMLCHIGQPLRPNRIGVIALNE